MAGSRFRKVALRMDKRSHRGERVSGNEWWPGVNKSTPVVIETKSKTRD
jgi:hypothetical protein